jgi:hypothetical protein
MLVDLYGKWDNTEDIDFNELPNSFVLKTNHGCGTIVLVEDKNIIDVQKTKNNLNKWLKLEFGVITAEPHYKNIKPCIIAEERLIATTNMGLIDYKFWCLDGEPFFVLVCYDRVIGSHTKLCIFDLDWNLHPEYLDGSHVKDKDNTPLIPKPQCFNEMLDASRILSKGFPEVRVDLYVVNGKPYFGELTFTSLGGYMDYFTPELLLKMGERIHLKK